MLHQNYISVQSFLHDFYEATPSRKDELLQWLVSVEHTDIGMKGLVLIAQNHNLNAIAFENELNSAKANILRAINTKNKSVNLTPTYLKWAAAILICIAAGTLTWFNWPKPQNPMAKYELYDQGLPVRMGVADDVIFNEFMTAYKAKQPEKAKQLFYPLFAKFSTNDTVLFYGGLVYYQNQIFDTAKLHLQQVTNMPSVFKARSSYWMGMSEWQLGNTAAAKSYFEQTIQLNEPTLAPLAREILSEQL